MSGTSSKNVQLETRPFAVRKTNIDQSQYMDLFDYEINDAEGKTFAFERDSVRILLRDVFRGRIIGGGLRYVSSDLLKLRPIQYHINDGNRDYFPKIAGETTINTATPNFPSAGSWAFGLGDNAGNITLAAATGGGTIRPTDAFFQWGEYGGSGFNHTKQGYYPEATKRALFALYKIASTSFYLINLHDGSDETGENIKGSWTRIGDIQEVWHDLSLGTIASWGAVYTTFTWTYPVGFVKVPKRSITGGMSQAGDTTTARILFNARRSASEGIGSSQFGARNVTGGTLDSTDVYASVFAKGKWK